MIQILAPLRAWRLPAVLSAWCGLLALLLLFWLWPQIDDLRQNNVRLDRQLTTSQREMRMLQSDIDRLPQLKDQAAMLETAGLFRRPDRWQLAGRIEAARIASGVEAVDFQIAPEAEAEAGGARALTRTPLSLRIVSADPAAAAAFIAALWQDGPRPIAMTGITQTIITGINRSRIETQIRYDWFSLLAPEPAEAGR